MLQRVPGKCSIAGGLRQANPCESTWRSYAKFGDILHEYVQLSAIGKYAILDKVHIVASQEKQDMHLYEILARHVKAWKQ